MGEETKYILDAVGEALQNDHYVTPIHAENRATQHGEPKMILSSGLTASMSDDSTYEDGNNHRADGFSCSESIGKKGTSFGPETRRHCSCYPVCC